MSRVLVVGAGASIEECTRSGAHPNDPMWSFPTIKNFCEKLFTPDSQALLEVTASYLDEYSVAFNRRLLSLEPGDSYTGVDIEAGPTGVFLRLERDDCEHHNIETLCEHAWRRFGSNADFWAQFIHDGIYLYLFAVFSTQFGLGRGRPMRAGVKVAVRLGRGDKVVNLNYDVAFDLALMQARKAVSYAPEGIRGSITIYKPHGSFNLYLNRSNSKIRFIQPDRIPGSVGFSDPDGGTFFSQNAIVPPRLNKSYEQHPAARYILNHDRPFSPDVLTFWGVGLTTSDVDLLSLYREAAKTASIIEFINPSNEACDQARSQLQREVIHHVDLDSWLSVSRVA